MDVSFIILLIAYVILLGAAASLYIINRRLIKVIEEIDDGR